MSKSRTKETNSKDSYKKEKFDIKDARIWKHKSGLVSYNLIDSVIKSQSHIKKCTGILNEGENYDRKKIKSFLSTDKFKDQKKDENALNDTVKKIMGDVGKIVMNIRNQEDTLSKANINALLETQNQIKKSEIIEEPNTILKIKEKEYKLALEGKLKKSPNYKFLSDSYRKQVNRFFNNYNPIIHLGNIHMLRKTDEEVDKQFKSHIREIDEELKNAKGFIYYKSDKNKKKLGDKKKKNDLDEPINSTNNYFTNIKPTGFTSYTIPTDATATMTEGLNTVKVSNNRRNIFNKKMNNKKREIKKKFPDKENREIELNLMKNVCEQLESTISPKNINNYIVNYKNLNNSDMPQQKHIYFGNIESAHKILTEIQENLLIKKMEEDIRNRKKQTSVESERLLDKLNELKSSLLFEIDEQQKKQNKLYNK